MGWGGGALDQIKEETFKQGLPEGKERAGLLEIQEKNAPGRWTVSANTLVPGVWEREGSKRALEGGVSGVGR